MVYISTTVNMFSMLRSMSDLQAPVCCAALTSTPIAEDDAVLLAGVLKALADPVRVRLVSIIASSGAVSYTHLTLPTIYAV